MHVLERFKELVDVVEQANKEMAKLKIILENDVRETGSQISAHGYIARLKPGRKSIDHKLAALSVAVSDDIINKFTSTPKPKTSWAKVTKELELDNDTLDIYTTRAESSFVIEPV